MRHMALILAASGMASPMLCSMSKDGDHGDNHTGGGGHSKAHQGKGDGAQHGDLANQANATSGLDTSGEMRIGERYTIAVGGKGLVLRQSHSGREVDVTEAEFAGLIENEYFRDKGN